MNKIEVMKVIDSLAMSQGFYGRLGYSIREAEDNGEDTSSFFDKFKNCRDAVDVVTIIEG